MTTVVLTLRLCRRGHVHLTVRRLRDRRNRPERRIDRPTDLRLEEAFNAELTVSELEEMSDEWRPHGMRGAISSLLK